MLNINKIFKNIQILSSVIILFLMVGLILALVFSAISESSLNELSRTTKPPSITTSNRLNLKENLCNNFNSDKFLSYYFPYGNRTLYFPNKKIYSIIEVCYFNQSYYCLHFGNELRLINFRRDSIASASLKEKLNVDYIEMIVSNKYIIYNDGAENLFIYDLDLKYFETKAFKNSILTGMAFDKIGKNLYIAEINKGFRVLDENFIERKFIETPINSRIIVSMGPNGNIFYVDRNSGSFAVVFTSKSSFYLFDQNNIKIRATSFFVNNDGVIFSYSKNSFKNYSIINVSKTLKNFAEYDQVKELKFKTIYVIRNPDELFIDSKDQIVASDYKNKTGSVDILNGDV